MSSAFGCSVTELTFRRRCIKAPANGKLTSWKTIPEQSYPPASGSCVPPPPGSRTPCWARTPSWPVPSLRRRSAACTAPSSTAARYAALRRTRLVFDVAAVCDETSLSSTDQDGAAYQEEAPGVHPAGQRHPDSSDHGRDQFCSGHRRRRSHCRGRRGEGGAIVSRVQMFVVRCCYYVFTGVTFFFYRPRICWPRPWQNCLRRWPRTTERRRETTRGSSTSRCPRLEAACRSRSTSSCRWSRWRRWVKKRANLFLIHRVESAVTSLLFACFTSSSFVLF